MAEKQETTAALIAEYHADADKMDAHELPQPTTQYLRIMLARFDAAHRRETATAEKSSAVGDCAKMREALEATLKLFWDMHNANRSPQSNQAYAVIRQIKAALAAPPRNCDRFQSASDAWDAYDAFVDSYRAQSKTEPLNEFGWLYAKATEKEGDAK